MQVVEFLSQRGVQFTQKDVRKDPQALQELIDGGFTATPVTMIDGTAVVGYNVPALTRALGLDS